MRCKQRADCEIVDIALQKCTHRILGCADDRLLVHIETRIDHRGRPGSLLECLKNAKKTGIRLFADQLWACRAVDMDRGRTHAYHLVRTIESDCHEFGRLLTTRQVVK